MAQLMEKDIEPVEINEVEQYRIKLEKNAREIIAGMTPETARAFLSQLSAYDENGELIEV